LRLSGFSKIITTSSTKHEVLVKKYGATDLIDRSLSLDEQVKKIQSIAPHIDYVFDTVVGKDTVEVGARSLRSKGGRLVTVLSVDEAALAPYKNVTVSYIYSSPVAHPESATPLWSSLEEALKKGDILPLPYRVEGGLDKAAAAFAAIKKASGYKVLIHPQE
jgi:NADPH:quinone reductase-like Zn-dependent oxidoreductase